MSARYVKLGDTVTEARYAKNNNPERWAPVVVIDPEDREAIHGVVRAFFAHKPAPLADWEVELMGADREFIEVADRLQAALREFANPTPPKPEEPTGLGAVVEDAEGQRWVRVYSSASFPWSHDGTGSAYQPWRHVDAVRVLSEGVTP